MKEPLDDRFAAKALLFILGFAICALFLVGYEYAYGYAHKNLYQNQVSDEVLGTRYAHGVKFSFHNTDPDSQQAIQYIADALEGIEELVGFDPFIDNYLVEVWGASYNEGVKPVEFDYEGQAVVVNMPNKIDLIHITSDGLLGQMGDVYLSNWNGSMTIRISITE